MNVGSPVSVQLVGPELKHTFSSCLTNSSDESWATPMSPGMLVDSRIIAKARFQVR